MQTEVAQAPRQQSMPETTWEEAEFTRVSMQGEVFVVGSTILPFHLVVQAGRTYLFNTERVSAFEVDIEFARRVSSYEDAYVSIPLSDFFRLQAYGLVASPSDSEGVYEAINTRASRYQGCVKTLVLNVIQACNLRCEYCFAGDGSYGNAGRMPFETVVKAIDWYARQHTQIKMEINFFGGEPLANAPLIRQAVEYSRAVARSAGKTVSFSMTTNATLVNQEVAHFLAENDFRIAVSIDGPPIVNDRNRPFASGKGSLERVLEGVRLLREAGNHPIARCTVFGKTDIADVQRYLAAAGFEQVHVAKATLPAGREDSEALAAVVHNAKLEGAALSDARRDGRPLSNCVSKLADLIVKNQRQTRACGVGDKIASVGIDGGIYACHRFTNDKKWKIADVDGRVNPGRFHDRAVNDIDKCRSCWAKYLCGGGCRHDNYSATGDPFLPPDEFCHEMKAYAEEAIVVACGVSNGELKPLGGR